jgi:thioredoxin 2
MSDALLIICPACGTKNRLAPNKSHLTPKCGQCGTRLSVSESAAEAPGHPLPATDATFRQVVLDAHLPVLVDFWAPWCMPCRQLAPALELMAQEFAGRLTVVKVNTDENRQLGQTYRIQSIPTLMLFENGQMTKQFVGGLPVGQLRNWINLALGWL